PRPPPPLPSPPLFRSAVALRDLNGDGKPEAVFADNVTIGSVHVLPTPQAGLITSATGGGGTVTVTSPNHGLVVGQEVSISGNTVDRKSTRLNSSHDGI